MGIPGSKSKSRDQVIVDAWRQLGSESLGQSELESIQRVLEETFDGRIAMSPAAIARTIADCGARLRHSEILRVDSEWRRRRLSELFAPGELVFTTIDDAFESMQLLDELNTHFNSEGDETGAARLRELALELKSELEVIARAKVKVGHERLVAREVVQWLKIWLQTPHLFEDWVQLRRSSAEFKDRFGQQSE